MVKNTMSNEKELWTQIEQHEQNMQDLRRIKDNVRHNIGDIGVSDELILKINNMIDEEEFQKYQLIDKAK